VVVVLQADVVVAAQDVAEGEEVVGVGPHHRREPSVPIASDNRTRSGRAE
jgi:hypothetical protein